MRQQNRNLLSLLFCLMLCSGCCRFLDFKPYDYEKEKDAKLQIQTLNGSIGIRPNKLYFKKDLP